MVFGGGLVRGGLLGVSEMRFGSGVCGFLVSGGVAWDTGGKS